MKIAVFSDIHGNKRALEAVFYDIRKERPDQIVCAGDIVNPLDTSVDVWRVIRDAGMPIVRGNHEDYVISCFRDDGRPEIRSSVQYRPVAVGCRRFTDPDIAELQALPFSCVVSGPGGDDVYVCHASPFANNKSYVAGIGAQMAESLRKIPQSTIVAGHLHKPWDGTFEGKFLVGAGSVGLPLHGKSEAEYVVLEHLGGSWRARHKYVPVDQRATARDYLNSGLVHAGGPLAWLLFGEFYFSRPCISTIFPQLNTRSRMPNTESEWAAAVEEHLRRLELWEPVRKLVHSA